MCRPFGPFAGKPAPTERLDWVRPHSNQAEQYAAAVLTKTQHHAASFVMVGLRCKRYSRVISNPTDARHKDAFDD